MGKGAAVAVAALIAASCGRSVVIGVVLPETGSTAMYGASIKSGVRLAFDSPVRAGTATAVAIRVEYRDSASDATKAAALVEALFDDGAIAVIGGATTAEAKAVIPVAQRFARVIISPSASAPELATAGEYFFRIYPSDALEGVEAADFLVLTREARTVLIISEDNDYTRGLLPVFVGELSHHGAKVAATARTGESGWEGGVREAIVSLRPDAVYICGYGDAILRALEVVRASGHAGSVCTTSAINSESLLRRAGELVENVDFPLIPFDPSTATEPTRSFVRQYREAYDLAPDVYAACGYDAALTILASVGATGGGSGRDLQRGMWMTSVTGVTGPLRFDEHGGVRRGLEMFQIHRGRVVPLAVARPESLRRGGAEVAAPGRFAP